MARLFPWLAGVALLASCATSVLPPYTIRDHGIPDALTDAAPDATRGKAVLTSRESNCKIGRAHV